MKQLLSATTLTLAGLIAPVFAAPTLNVLGGGICINEFMADPNGTLNFDTDGSGTFDTDDEFIELYNLSGSAIDITGYQIWDPGGGLRFTFPATTILGAGRVAMVMGAVTSPGALPSVAPNLAFVADAGSLGINNGSDHIVVYDPGADEYIQAFFNGAAALNPTTDIGGFSATASLIGSVEDWGTDTDGTSLQRNPDGDATLVNTNTFSSGAYNATPGLLADNTLPVELSAFQLE